MDLESIRIALEVARTGVRVLLMQGFRDQNARWIAGSQQRRGAC